jgi:hypothetical protein
MQKAATEIKRCTEIMRNPFCMFVRKLPLARKAKRFSLDLGGSLDLCVPLFVPDSRGLSPWQS